MLAHRVLEAARVQASMSVSDLWLAYFALGGEMRPDGLRSYLADGTGRVEYDIVAQALNERFSDLGADHPVPYQEELGNGDGSAS
ncbi:MAG: hypothetical protein ACLGI2_11940 [Acidimicrobiia bacterium]